MESHCLSVATFQVKNMERANEVMIDDHMPFPAIIRKVCLCGSSVEFDWDTHKWLCSVSAAELDVPHWNCTPMLKGASAGIIDVSGFEHPDCTSVVKFGGNGDLLVLLKVEPKNQWIISDPLPVFDHLKAQPFETDLLLRWFINIEDNVSSGLSYEIFWNMADPTHRQIVESLASSKAVTLNFLDAGTLVPFGATVLELYQPSNQDAVTQALALTAALPKDENERREQLDALALGREASMLSFMDKIGLCPQMVGFFFHSSFSLEKATELADHMRKCSICRRSNTA